MATALFLVNLAAIILVTAFSPAEKTLGVNARIVYLHGAWVWAAMGAYLAASGLGLAGLVGRKRNWQTWSQAFGRSGLVFWIAYLPLSLWAMQTNWNGLFLAEPRWRFAIVFAFGGLLLQIGLALVEDPAWAAVGNLIFVIIMFLSLQRTENVMHPPSPMLNSNTLSLQLTFGGLLILTLLAAYQVTRWFYKASR